MDRAEMKKTVHGSRFTVHGQKGLTLIEVLVALTILAIGLLGVSLMQVMSITGNTYSRQMAVATELAQDMLEKFGASTYTATAEDSSLSAGNHPDANDVPGLAPAVFNAGAVDDCDHPGNTVDERGLQIGPTVYIRTWTVTDNNPATDMKTIVVTVCWEERDTTGTTARSVEITGVKVRG